MATTMLRNDASIDRCAHVHLIREVLARSPLFREAAISETALDHEGALALDVSFNGGPAVFRVVSGSADRAYATLYELALAMVDVDQQVQRSHQN
jgi:hypothetical protein